MDDAYKALQAAILDKDVGGCRAAIAAGADVNEVKNGYNEALLMALLRSSPDVVHVLLEAGANPNGRNSLMPLLVRLVEPENIELAKLLIEAGADVNAANPIGFPVLHLAVAEDNSVLCRLLLERGVIAEALSRSGALALSIAAGNKNVEICKLLMEYGASPSYVPPSADTRFLTSFEKMVKKGDQEMVEFFVEQGGIDLAQKTMGGKTLTELAGKNEGMVGLLHSLAAKAAMRQVMGF